MAEILTDAAEYVISGWLDTLSGKPVRDADERINALRYIIARHTVIPTEELEESTRMAIAYADVCVEAVALATERARLAGINRQMFGALTELVRQHDEGFWSSWESKLDAARAAIAAATRGREE